MFTCINYGKLIDKNTKFCKFCGTKIEKTVQDMMICSNCGKELIADSKFCRYCGGKVKG